MDKVRTIVRVIWIQRFWVLSLISALVAVLCWNMAAGDLQAEFTKRKGAIDNAYNSVNGIKNEQVHPNDNVNRGDMEQAKQQRGYVLEVWQELYESQRSKVLSWPENLGEQFVNYMEKRKFRDNISSEMRGFYHNYIETRFDALLEIVKAKKMNTGSRSLGGRSSEGQFGGEYGGGFGGENGGMAGDTNLEDEDYLVQWLDQGKLQQKLSFKTKPSSTQVWVTQEDIWVYETLLHVIADTNKSRGATRPDNAAVRVIVNLQVGSAAAGGSTGKVYIPQPTEGGGMGGGYEGMGGEYGGMGGEYGGMGGEYGGMGEGMGEGMGGEYGGMGGEYGGRGMGGGGDGSLLANRYLDAEGKPDPGTGETVGSTEFRQLPIRMTLMMDQRVIPRILIECANAALPVEVKQLRVNPSQSGGNFGGRSSSGSRNKNLQGLVPDVNLAEVEIRGVVYIYNPPDTNELAIPGAEEGISSSEVALQ